jgi:hypothetical protein
MSDSFDLHSNGAVFIPADPGVQVVHGLSIPLGKLGFYLPRTLSHAFDSQQVDEPEPFHIRDRVHGVNDILRNRRRTRTSGTSTPNRAGEPDRPMYRIGGTVIRERASGTITPVEDGDGPPQTQLPVNRTIRFPDEAHS